MKSQLLRAIGFYFFSLISVGVVAQQDVSLHPSHVTKHALAMLIHKQIDSLRVSQKELPLQWNMDLAEAANEQAVVLLKTQKGFLVRQWLVDRGVYPQEVIEWTLDVKLIEQTNYFRPITNYAYRNVSYRQTALNVLLEGLKSKSAQNILSKTYGIIGVGAGVDTTTNNMKVVVVLASGLPAKSSIGNSQNVDGTYFLPSPKKSAVWFKRAKKKNRNLVMAQAWLGGRQSYPGWIFADRKKLKRAFRWYHFRSGLVVETISSTSFLNEEEYLSIPSRTNQRHILNGSIGKRITRREIMQLSKNVIPKKVMVLGIKTPFNKWPKTANFQLPVSVPDGSSINLLMIRKARLCDIIDYHIQLTAELIPTFPILEYRFLAAIKPIDTVHKSTINEKFCKLYYQKNQTQLTPEDEQELLALVPDFSKVKTIKIHSFASIEGSLVRNQKLFNERGAAVKQFLERNGMLTTDAVLSLKTEENWELMNEQLRSDDVKRNRRRLANQNEIRAYANKNAGDSLIKSWLDQQRYSIISFELEKTEVKIDNAKDVLEAFETIVASGKFTRTNLLKLEALQKRYYELLVLTHQQANSQLIVPSNLSSPNLIFREAEFMFLYRGLSENEFHNKVKQVANLTGISAAVRARCIKYHQVLLANTIFGSGSETPTKDDWNCPFEKSQIMYLATLKKHQHKMTDYPPSVEALDLLLQLRKSYQTAPDKKELVRQLDFYYYVTRAQLLARTQQFKFFSEIQGLSSQVWHRFVKNAPHSDDEAIEYSLFFNLTHNPQFAVELLKPLVEREQPNPKAFMIWTSIVYDSGKEKETEDHLLDALRFLTPQQWVELATSGGYLPVTVLERIKLRQAWKELLR
ncbi:MAG: hypothetical protein JSU09_00150 [Bacteroidetes bacterium]|nr:hypothetical protein [Bacteroidota bacterium]